MRKHIINSTQQELTNAEPEWLNLDELVEVEISSEDPIHPIENALLLGSYSGWLAAEPGKQSINLIFTRPQRLRRIRLSFVETEVQRTQEYVLRCSQDGGKSFHEVARQQWNFSPRGSTHEMEDHLVDLDKVNLLELTITPDISGGKAAASLALLRLA